MDGTPPPFRAGIRQEQPRLQKALFGCEADGPARCLLVKAPGKTLDMLFGTIADEGLPCNQVVNLINRDAQIEL